MAGRRSKIKATKKIDNFAKISHFGLLDFDAKMPKNNGANSTRNAESDVNDLNDARQDSVSSGYHSAQLSEELLDQDEIDQIEVPEDVCDEIDESDLDIPTPPTSDEEEESESEEEGEEPYGNRTQAPCGRVG